MKLSWGWNVALLYTCFAGMIIALVVASSRQKIDLVSKDYYKQELVYQDVLDAGKNQAGMSMPVSIHAGASTVTVELPAEMQGKELSGEIRFYSPVNTEWDRIYKMSPNDHVSVIPRAELENTRYIVKVSFSADGKKYYQESELQLHQ